MHDSLLSVIIATKNAGKNISQTFLSLTQQTVPPCEVIVQDGLSEDNTLSIVQFFQKRASFSIKIFSEPDTGLYQAWNRAVDRAQGQWILFLGAGDSLVTSNVLASVLPYLEKLDSNISLAYGMLVQYRAGRKKMGLWDIDEVSALAQMRQNMSLPFPATFLRRSLFQARRFDESYKIAGDFRFVSSLIRPDNFVRLPILVTKMELGGLSSDPRWHDIAEAERIRVCQEVFGA